MDIVAKALPIRDGESLFDRIVATVRDMVADAKTPDEVRAVMGSAHKFAALLGPKASQLMAIIGDTIAAATPVALRRDVLGERGPDAAPLKDNSVLARMMDNVGEKNAAPAPVSAHRAMEAAALLQMAKLAEPVASLNVKPVDYTGNQFRACMNFNIAAGSYDPAKVLTVAKPAADEEAPSFKAEDSKIASLSFTPAQAKAPAETVELAAPELPVAQNFTSIKGNVANNFTLSASTPLPASSFSFVAKPEAPTDITSFSGANLNPAKGPLFSGPSMFSAPTLTF